MKTVLLILAAVSALGSTALAVEPAQPQPSNAASVVRGRLSPAAIARWARPGTAWRYVFHQGRWWYWSPAERWSYFDGSRWVQLDSLDQPLNLRSDVALAERGLREFKPLPLQKLPAQRRRPGSFSVGAPFAGRTFVGPFGAGAISPIAPVLSPRVYGPISPNRYGADSVYAPYGSTDPFRSGLHSGAGGNYGYGLGTQRPGAASDSQAAPQNRP